MHVDTGHNFPEVLEFRDRRVDELRVPLIVASVQQLIDEGRVVEETGPRASRNRLQTAALLNAVWDLYARVEKKPLWLLLAEMEPERIASAEQIDNQSGEPTKKANARMRPRIGLGSWLISPAVASRRCRPIWLSASHHMR